MRSPLSRRGPPSVAGSRPPPDAGHAPVRARHPPHGPAGRGQQVAAARVRAGYREPNGRHRRRTRARARRYARPRDQGWRGGAQGDHRFLRPERVVQHGEPARLLTADHAGDSVAPARCALRPRFRRHPGLRIHQGIRRGDQLRVAHHHAARPRDVPLHGAGREHSRPPEFIRASARRGTGYAGGEERDPGHVRHRSGLRRRIRAAQPVRMPSTGCRAPM